MGKTKMSKTSKPKRSCMEKRPPTKPRNGCDPRFWSAEKSICQRTGKTIPYVIFNPSGTNLVAPETMQFFKKNTLKVTFSDKDKVHQMSKWETFFHEAERKRRIEFFEANRGNWINERIAEYEKWEQTGHLPKTKYYGYPYIFDQETLNTTAKNEEMAMKLIDERGVLISINHRPYAPK
jgi:hypothetical protein